MKLFMVLPVSAKGYTNARCYLIEFNSIVKNRLEELANIRKTFDFDFLERLDFNSPLSTNVWLMPSNEMRGVNSKIDDVYSSDAITFIYLSDSDIEELNEFCQMDTTELRVCSNEDFYFIEYGFDYDYVESFMFNLNEFKGIE